MYAMVSRDIAPISLNYGRFRSIWGKKSVEMKTEKNMYHLMIIHIFFFLEKCDKENTEREITQATDSCFTHGEMQDQSIWGNCSDDELIRSKYFWRKLE